MGIKRTIRKYGHLNNYTYTSILLLNTSIDIIAIYHYSDNNTLFRFETFRVLCMEHKAICIFSNHKLLRVTCLFRKFANKIENSE